MDLKPQKPESRFLDLDALDCQTRSALGNSEFNESLRMFWMSEKAKYYF